MHVQRYLMESERGLSRAMLTKNGRQDALCFGFAASVRYSNILLFFVVVDCFLVSQRDQGKLFFGMELFKCYCPH